MLGDPQRARDLILLPSREGVTSGHSRHPSPRERVDRARRNARSGLAGPPNQTGAANQPRPGRYRGPRAMLGAITKSAMSRNKAVGTTDVDQDRLQRRESGAGVVPVVRYGRERR